MYSPGWAFQSSASGRSRSAGTKTRRFSSAMSRSDVSCGIVIHRVDDRLGVPLDDGRPARGRGGRARRGPALFLGLADGEGRLDLDDDEAADPEDAPDLR